MFLSGSQSPAFPETGNTTVSPLNGVSITLSVFPTIANTCVYKNKTHTPGYSLHVVFVFFLQVEHLRCDTSITGSDSCWKNAN